MSKEGFLGYGSPQALEAAIKAQDDNHLSVVAESLLYIMVCSDLPEEEVIGRMRRRICGTSGGWQFTKEPTQDCSEKQGFRHYLFVC